MSIEQFIKELSAEKDRSIVHIEHIPEQPARFGELIPPLEPPVAEALRYAGINDLYTHQRDAITAARRGDNVLQATPTASGKTLGFIAPVLEVILNDPAASAIFVFPTKALAQDQLRNLNRLLEYSPPLKKVVRPGVYDGDTPPEKRRKIQREANIIITNPDMLHAAIIPHHGKWARVMSGLRYVILDELHAYRGIFGSNVSNVIRRLRRILRHYDAEPRYLMASATIANPEEHAAKLVGNDVTVIDRNGSPQGERYFILFNPPFDDPKLGARRSANVEATEIMADLVSRGIQTIVFTRARVVAELIYRYANEKLGPKLGGKISPYRGGYLPEERRAIERALFSGELLGVTSTNALELGIDIGGLDASVLVGFPGSIASLLQQAGRAGRRNESSLSVLIGYDDPIDQYLCRYPGYIFGNSPESAIIDPDNPYILAGHLRCAAHELPITETDRDLFGNNSRRILEELSGIGDVVEKEDKYWWISQDYPAMQTNLRTGDDNTVTIIDAGQDDKTIGSLDYESALEQLHPEAIYLQNGETYFVRELDLAQKVAFVEQRNVDYYTQAMVESNLHLENEIENNDLGTFAAGLGDVTVTWATVGFKKIKFYKLDSIGWSGLDMPKVAMETVALYVTPTGQTLAKVQADGFNAFEALLGLRNGLLAVIPLLSMCDPRDLGGIVDSANLGHPTLFIYDKFHGGLGYSEHAFYNIARVIEDVYELVNGCPCEEGCPACVGPGVFSPDQINDPDLKTGHHIPVKAATVALAGYMLG
ncbi:MAG: DEAD/DEAH box helicase [bacterium]|nr:DEAD/DEAH box helicase [bacterium]